MGVLGGLLKAKSGAASFGRTRDLSRGGGDAPTPSNSELHCTLLNAHCTLLKAHCTLHTELLFPSGVQWQELGTRHRAWPGKANALLPERTSLKRGKEEEKRNHPSLSLLSDSWHRCCI